MRTFNRSPSSCNKEPPFGAMRNGGATCTPGIPQRPVGRSPHAWSASTRRPWLAQAPNGSQTLSVLARHPRCPARPTRHVCVRRVTSPAATAARVSSPSWPPASEGKSSRLASPHGRVDGAVSEPPRLSLAQHLQASVHSLSRTLHRSTLCVPPIHRRGKNHHLRRLPTQLQEGNQPVAFNGILIA